MNFLISHIELLTIIGSFFASIMSAMVWMNSKFNKIEEKLFELRMDLNKTEKKLNDGISDLTIGVIKTSSSLDLKISDVEKDISIIKTVLFVKGIMPSDLIDKKDKTSA